ncbi:DUF3467 domain-containing protein [Pseudomaricurvus sp.]|uniref:DUF3467 domain-containing protein n=1 Tax=Pseudomaricurvus sp. TaxID=2004510 RepID=UPI003F6D0D00
MSDNEKNTNEAAGNTNGNAASSGSVPKLKWDDSKMRSSYANVCNVSSTREEVTLLFGTNSTWHTGQKEVSINLSDRIILNPHAAKRLSALLNKVVDEYESRFGPVGD